ncbi:hypothetical protein VPNG_09836 [Cytospora leucostoma]|uniref:Uncharacterized protein n=1 Tax=Cytospora leucostoma TaxID=1230097 RepID=A0A423VIH0_9PEZI|nr:hypothetical protein VPNG_09836 [Cytospora leucostoma]
MAPPAITEQSTATHRLHCFTPSFTSSSTSRIIDVKRRLRALYDQPQLSSMKTTSRTSAKYSLHESNQLGRTVPELRQTMKRAGLNGKSHPRYRRRGRRSRHDYHVRSPQLSCVEVEEAVETRSSMMKMDWKEEEEESVRPCYWSLVEKLNRELRITGE